MLSLRIIRLAKRALASPLAVVLEAGLASFGAPSATQVEGVTEARAAEGMMHPVATHTLHDSLPSRSRGGRLRIVMVANSGASPGTHSVTLWDELARPAPAPRPMPVDAAGGGRSASAGHVTSIGFVLRPPAGTFFFSWSAL